MLRNFPVRTGLTGVRSRGAPLYGTDWTVFDDFSRGRSAGYLSSFTAPLPKRCPKVGSDSKANTVSATARRQSSEAISARKMTEAEGRTFFVFIVRVVGTSHKPEPTENRRCCGTLLFVFGEPPGCIIFRRMRQNFCTEKTKKAFRCPFRSRKMLMRRSAHPAVRRPIHLGDLASHHVRFETPTADRRCRPFWHDHVMAWQ